jgi:hypothetical protein
MPERMSNEKLMTMKALGAEIVRTPSAVSWTHQESLISVAQRLLKEVFPSYLATMTRLTDRDRILEWHFLVGVSENKLESSQTQVFV